MSARVWRVSFWQPGAGALVDVLLEAATAGEAEAEARTLMSSAVFELVDVALATGPHTPPVEPAGGLADGH